MNTSNTHEINIDELSDVVNTAIKGYFQRTPAILATNLRHSQFVVLKAVTSGNRLDFNQVWFPEQALPAVVAARCPNCKPKIGNETYWHWNGVSSQRICDMEEKDFVALLNSMIQIM